MVIHNLFLAWEGRASSRLWWVQVTVTPEASRIIVLRSGTEKGSSVVIACGGHNKPVSIQGDNLE